MRLTTLYNLTRPNWFYRAVAIFFLAFTAVDLACPSLCQGEGSEVCAVALEADSVAQFEDNFVNKSADHSTPRQESEMEGHDCFCCCTHLTAVDLARMEARGQMAEVVARPIVSLPVAPSPGPDHPPRLI